MNLVHSETANNWQVLPTVAVKAWKRGFSSFFLAQHTTQDRTCTNLSIQPQTGFNLTDSSRKLTTIFLYSQIQIGKFPAKWITPVVSMAHETWSSYWLKGTKLKFIQSKSIWNWPFLIQFSYTKLAFSIAKLRLFKKGW